MSETPDQFAAPGEGPCLIATCYRFVALDELAALRQSLAARCRELGLVGTILLAGEGINMTVAGSRAGLEGLLRHLDADPRLAGLRPRFTRAAAPPFRRMKIKLRREIVTLGVEGLSPLRRTGRHVAPARWNEVIADPDVLVLDTRNVYETGIGSFAGAVTPDTRNFREFPAWVERELDPARHRRVAMFCTGGIRCEKASALLLERGFEEVLQLEGGILAYLEQVPASHSRWWGECFVFDDRVAVDDGLAPGSHAQCHACRRPVSDADRDHPHYEAGVSCPACYAELTPRQRASFTERRRQRALAAARAAAATDDSGTSSSGEHG